MKPISTLLCGQPNYTGITTTALNTIGSSLDEFGKKSNYFLNTDTEDLRLFGAFCARVLLENGLSAIVGRIDPFRISYLSKFQAQSDYEAGKRAKTSFAWTGDVMQSSTDKTPQNLWHIENDNSKVGRYLFSEHVDNLFWTPACESALDYISTTDMDDELVNSIDPTKFINIYRGKCTQLYSTLSKGVHWEFFNPSFVYDKTTIIDSIRQTFEILSLLGLISHFIPTAYGNLAPDKAIQAYTTFKGQFS